MTEQRYAQIMLTGQASGCTIEEAAEALERYRAALRRSLAPRGMPVVVADNGHTRPSWPMSPRPGEDDAHAHMRAVHAMSLPRAIARYVRR